LGCPSGLCQSSSTRDLRMPCAYTGSAELAHAPTMTNPIQNRMASPPRPRAHHATVMRIPSSFCSHSCLSHRSAVLVVDVVRYSIRSYHTRQHLAQSTH